MFTWRRENRREWKRTKEPAAARVPRHLVRVKRGPASNKVVHIKRHLLYLLAISLAINDMSLSYSQQPVILLSLLLGLYNLAALPR